jgi:hypothetical protein
MKHCNKILQTIGLVTIVLGLCLVNGTAQSATGVPNISVLPAITAEISTPVRLAKDTAGNIFVTDPLSGGILKYNNVASTVQHIPTSKSGSGVAIAQNGDLLVTQGTYVAVFQKNTNGDYIENVNLQFGVGTFTYANGIAVDPSGNIYVTDGQKNNVQSFSASYAPLVTSPVGTVLARPSGIQYEKVSQRLVVTSSLNGTIKFLIPATLALDTTVGVAGVVGTFGYITPAERVAGSTVVKFTYPQGIAFEYNDAGTVLDRIYVSDSYQGVVQVLDGASKTWLADIGGYGFTDGKLFLPSDVIIDQGTVAAPLPKRLFVANGGGSVSVFGCDNMQPINTLVSNSTLNSLTVYWAIPANSGVTSVRVYRSTVANDPNPTLAANNQTGSSFNDTGLAQGTTYYYSVRAVVGTTEYANNQYVFGKTRSNYNLALTTTGTANTLGTVASGSIQGPPACLAASCPTNTLIDNTIVTLIALPSATTSVFGGWTGYCDPTVYNPDVLVNADQCSFSMTANRVVGAVFDPQMPFFVDGYLLDTLQGAHNTAEKNGSVIEVLSSVAGKPWPASTINAMTTEQPFTVYIKGGFDSEFAAPTAGTSVIKGKVNLRTGKTIFNNIKITP